MEMPGNESTDEEPKTTQEDSLLPAQKYPPQDLINLIKTEVLKIKNGMKTGKKRSNGIKIQKG
jgi:hypothetical protein